MAKIKCDYCGKAFNRKPSKIKAENYCSKGCRHLAKYSILHCDSCGKEFERANGVKNPHNFCSLKCARKFTSARMSDMNVKMNPDRMTPSTREKIRFARLGTGEGKSYCKTYGVHTHRIEAEKKIGRPLLKGEVVHHIDRDKRNNDHSNLMVLPSQAEHAKIHSLNRHHAKRK